MTGDSIQAAQRLDIVALMRGWSHWRTGSLAEYSHTPIGQCLADMPNTDCTLCHGSGHVPGSRYGSAMKFLPCPRCEATGKIDATPADSKVRTYKCSACKGSGEMRDLSVIAGKHTDAAGNCRECGAKTGDEHKDACTLAARSGRTCFRCHGSGVIERHDFVVNPSFISTTDGGVEEDYDPRYMVVDRVVCEFKRSARDLYIVIATEYMSSKAPPWWDAAKYSHLLAIAHDKIAEAVMRE